MAACLIVVGHLGGFSDFGRCQHYLSQLMRSLVAGPGPEAGARRREELLEESRRFAPEQI